MEEWISEKDWGYGRLHCTCSGCGPPRETRDTDVDPMASAIEQF